VLADVVGLEAEDLLHVSCCGRTIGIPPEGMYATETTVDRIEIALSHAAMSRLLSVGRLPDNPIGVERRTFGDGHVALLVTSPVAHYAYFSRPFDIRAEHLEVEGLVAWYRQHGAACYVHLSPYFATEQMLKSLHAAGLRQSGFLNILCGVPGPDTRQELPQGVHVQRVDEATLDALVELLTCNAAAQERQLCQRLARAEFTDWRCFLAYCDDQPAACAALYVDRPTRTSVLAAAGTLADYRGRGCHTALIAARLAEAAGNGCTLVAVEATPGSISQRNLERAGLQVVETHAIWSF